MQDQNANTAGFTLLEVVVAMAILGLGIVMLLEIFSLGLRLETKSFDTTEAITQARQAMDEYLVRRDIKDGTIETPSKQDGRRTRVQVAPVHDETQLFLGGAWELKEINLEADYRGGGGDNRLELTTHRVVKRTGR